MGGLVIDSTTPSLEKRGGKGVLGGGKNSGEAKYGTYQVLVGEGERPWNDKIDDAIAITQQDYLLENPALTGDRGDIGEIEEYRATNLASSNRYNDYEYSQTFSSGSNTYNITLTTHVAVGGADVRGHCYYFIGDGWEIPSHALPSLVSISSNFAETNTNLLTDIGIAVEQDGKLFFRGITTNAPYWYGNSGGITITRAMLQEAVPNWIAGTTPHTPGLTPAALNLGSGAPPLKVYILLNARNGGNGIAAGQQNIVNLRGTQISYRANALVERGALSLSKIWMNDEIWYNSESTVPAQITANNTNQQYFTFYPGTLAQTQDPSLVALRGAANVPGLQGYSHIVFHNLPLQKWSNNYPTVKVQVTSTLAATPEVIIRDLLFRAGVRYNKPLIEGKDWVWSRNDNGTAAINTSTYSGVDIDGYVVSFGSDSLKNYLAEISQIFRISIVSNPSLNIDYRTDTGFLHQVSPLYKVVPTALAKTITVENEVLGTADVDGDSLPWPTAIEGKSADEIPGQVEVQYHNLNKSGETESVVMDRATFQIGGDYTFTPNYYANRKVGTARSIANFILFQGLARAKQITTTSFPNQNLGLQNLVDWQGELSIRPQKLTLGANGVYEAVGIAITDEDLQEDSVEDPIDDNQDPSDVSSGLEVIWTEGQSILAPTTGNRRTIYAWMSPPAGSAIGEPASILLATDGSTFGTTAINGQPANAQQITINSIPSINNTDFRYYALDTEGSITVTVPRGVELVSADLQAVLEGTRNTLYVQTYGFIGFQTATLIAPRRYRLTDLFWNLGQGLIDEAWTLPQTATTGWLILGQPYELVISPSVVKGTPISLIAATNGANSPIFERTYRALNSSPRHIDNFSIEYLQGSQDIRFDWTPYIDQDTQLAPNLLDDPIVTGDTYDIYIVEGVLPATIRRTVLNHSSRFYVYTEANQIADGVVDRSELTYEIIQRGTINTLDRSVVYASDGSIRSIV